jgi:DNA polymerase-3 subunit gamma/tau
MDAASRTGVGDIRELIDTVRYAPTSARYKIYIIDEVHMLSTSAFNALLKTLEEPPPHVKFIFATTEARKIPVTILSRCQRFDLKRITLAMLAEHLGNIARKESATLSPEALALLAQSAEGSVRDGLSLLDQAISHHAQDEAQVRAMLGLGDRGQTIALLETLLKGEAAQAVAQLRALYEAGADPQQTLQDLLELTHFITRVKLAPQVAGDIAYAQHEREMASALAARLSMPVVARLWQMLLKGVGEVRLAPSPIAAAEMVLVRTAYASALPTPQEALASLAAAPPQPVMAEAEAQKKTSELGGVADSGLRVADRPVPAEPLSANRYPPIADFPALITCLEAAREPMLAGQLRQFASLVKFAAGQVELFMHMPVTREFTTRIEAALARETGTPWRIMLAQKPGEPTLHEQHLARQQERKLEAAEHPLVASVLQHFPGAEIVDIKESA